MKCPYCSTEFPSAATSVEVRQGKDAGWFISHEFSPCCGQMIIALSRRVGHDQDTGASQSLGIIFPRNAARPLPAEVPEPFASDFREACLVLADSPKASAALSRRCLQNLLRDVAKTQGESLAVQIDEVLRGSLPTRMRDLIGRVRASGNFATYPIKSIPAGEVVEVEPGEAETLLDILEVAFDFYLVQPVRKELKRDATNQELAATGTPPSK
jgi:hypothetical protein